MDKEKKKELQKQIVEALQEEKKLQDSKLRPVRLSPERSAEVNRQLLLFIKPL
jgi:hypothetical protein